MKKQETRIVSSGHTGRICMIFSCLIYLRVGINSRFSGGKLMKEKTVEDFFEKRSRGLKYKKEDVESMEEFS